MRSGILALCALALAACASTPDPVTEPEGRISGRLLDAQGAPLHGYVSIVSSGGSETRGTQADGTFVFEDVAPYSHTVTGRTIDGRIVCVDGIQADQAGMQLVVQPGATVWVELAGMPKARLAVSSGETRVHNFTLREGKRVPVIVPAGDVLLRLYSGRDDERRLTLAAGESADVRFGGR